MAAKDSIGLLDTVKTLDKKLLPAIWCSFNSWEFPSHIKEISDLKPLLWDKFDRDEKQRVTTPISRYIESVIEPKEISREWNKDRVSHEQFESWWKMTYEGRNTLHAKSLHYKQIKQLFARVKYFKQ